MPAYPNLAHCTGFSPEPFALQVQTAADGGRPMVVAWGMTLPDGSALTVDWRNGPSSSVAVLATPERAELLYDADLVWLHSQQRRLERT